MPAKTQLTELHFSHVTIMARRIGLVLLGLAVGGVSAQARGRRTRF